MKTVDVLIVTFAVIALAGSVAGTLLYETPGQDFAVTFGESEVDVADRSADLSGTAGLPGSSAADDETIVHNVTAANLTALSFELTASGASTTRGAAISVQMVLIAPDGTEVETKTASIGSSASGFGNPVVFDVPAEFLNEAPEGRTLRADTVDAARAQIGEEASMAGTGDWTIEVTASFPTLSTGPTGEDIEITSSPTATAYSANVAPAVDLGATA